LDSIGFNGPADGKVRKTSGDLAGVTGNAPFDALPFDKRVQLFEGAVRAKAQIDADSDRLVKEQRTQLAEGAMKQAYKLQSEGKLTKTYVEKISPLLSPSEYKSLLTSMDGKRPDAATYSQLQKLIYTNPQEAERYAFTAHGNGNLSNEHFAAALTKAREIQRTEGPKSEFERSRAYIVGSLDPGPMVQDPVGRSRLAEALDTFDRWVQAGGNKPRTDEEIKARGREVVDQYKFIDLSQSVIALPHPRSGQIRRNPSDVMGMQADVVSAANKAKAEFEAGRLTEADYKLEMETLNRWRKAIASAPQPKPQGNK
jgi:hypothetical protein